MAEKVLYLLLLFIAVMYVVAPLIVWRKSLNPCTYSFPPIDWKVAIDKAGPTFFAAHDQLNALGYYPAAASSMGYSHASFFFVVYRSELDSALVTIMRSKSAALEHVSLDITQRYEGGVHLSLSNATTPMIFPFWEKRRVYRLPGVTDVRELLERFRSIRSRVGISGPVTVEAGDELRVIESFANEELKHLCDTGFMEPTCSNGMRRLTVRGAYLSSWKSLPPWRWIQTKIARSTAMRLSSDKI